MGSHPEGAWLISKYYDGNAYRKMKGFLIRVLEYLTSFL